MSDECPHGLIASPASASQIPQPSGGGGGGCRRDGCRNLLDVPAAQTWLVG